MRAYARDRKEGVEDTGDHQEAGGSGEGNKKPLRD
jgi:hypothetical protein